LTRRLTLGLGGPSAMPPAPGDMRAGDGAFDRADRIHLRLARDGLDELLHVPWHARGAMGSSPLSFTLGHRPNSNAEPGPAHRCPGVSGDREQHPARSSR
jgi:hypothetical protein